MFNKKLLGVLAYWIMERDSMRKKKDAGLDKPWTQDKILRMHRWCNVRRMDDKVSKWLMDSWYTLAMRDDPRLAVTAATLARLINWPDTLENLRPFVKWSMARTLAKIQKHKARGGKVFTGAYIINGASGGDKIVTVCKQVDAVWRMKPSPVDTSSMENTWRALQVVPGIGSFIAGQIVADLRWALSGTWDDRIDWAPLGPGSARGMRRLLGKEPRGPLKQSEFNVLLPQLWDALMAYPEASEVFDDRFCEAMDLQNCLCEFDKYMRLKNGEGTVRSGYPGMP